jgi:hypothetical protein
MEPDATSNPAANMSRAAASSELYYTRAHIGGAAPAAATAAAINKARVILFIFAYPS